MNDKVTRINKSIKKWEIDKERGSLSEAVDSSTIEFKDTNQGIEVLAYAATARALGLSNSCLLYTSPSPRDKRQSRMPSSA